MTTITLPRATVEQALEALETPIHEQPLGMRQEAITALRAALAQQPEPVEPVDVGLLEYRGNSVAFIHQKMTAYRTGIDAAWDALRANGLHPDGKTPLADMITKYTAPPQRKPLPKHDQHCVDVPGYGLISVRLVRAVERAHGIGRQTDPQIEDRLARHGIPKP